jgi:ferritin
MLNQKLQDGFNDQLNYELYSSYIYLSAAAHFESVNLKGMANWMRSQAQEEVAHAAKFFDHINERGGKVVLKEIAGPKTEWESPLEAFEDAYKHECKVSARINNLVDLAINERDHASDNFLQWFVAEQVEEEASVLEIVEQLKLVGNEPQALFLIDRELGQRTPAALSTSE